MVSTVTHVFTLCYWTRIIITVTFLYLFIDIIVKCTVLRHCHSVLCIPAYALFIVHCCSEPGYSFFLFFSYSWILSLMQGCNENGKHGCCLGFYVHKSEGWGGGKCRCSCSCSASNVDSQFSSIIPWQGMKLKVLWACDLCVIGTCYLLPVSQVVVRLMYLNVLVVSVVIFCQYSRQIKVTGIDINYYHYYYIIIIRRRRGFRNIDLQNPKPVSGEKCPSGHSLHKI